MSDTPWLDDMLADVGVHEIAGPKANPRIVKYFEDVGHPEETSDETAWCAARIGAALVHTGYPIPPVNVNLMARSYCTYGVECEPKPGAIVIFPRGNSSWQGHVGCVVAVLPGMRVKYIAGNQSNAVSYGEADIDHALNYRWPVAPTVAALREAGSTEIAKADKIQNGGILVTLIPTTLATAQHMLGPIDVPTFTDLPASLSWWQSLLGGVNAVGGLLAEHPWLAGTVILGLLCVLVGREIKAARVAKHEAGMPLSAEVHALAAEGA